MGFSDIQLKQLRDDLEIPERTMIVDEHDMRAILHRLECAEKVADAATECGIGKPLWEAWRKSKGE